MENSYVLGYMENYAAKDSSFYPYLLTKKMSSIFFPVAKENKLRG